MTRHRWLPLCFFSVALGGLALPTGCKNVGDVYTPDEWVKLLEDAGGWSPLPFPDSKYRAGSIIKVTEEGVRWIDHLDACEMPAEMIEPGQTPPITFSKSQRLGANALLNLHGIEAGPQYSRVAAVHLRIQDHGAEAVRLVRLRTWLEDPANRERAGPCLDELVQPDRYLVNEAFRVSKGVYTLYDAHGAAIKVDVPTLGSLLQLEPEAKVEVAASGSLVIEQPVYFAVRRAQRVGAHWETLGSSGGEKTADATIETLFMREQKP